MPINTTDREYRSFAVLEVTPAADTEARQEVRGYAATFNQPYTLYDDGEYRLQEQIDPHAFDRCDMGDVILQYDHEGRVFARQSNGTLQIATDSHGLLITADLSGTELGRGLYEDIRGGYITKMSIGFAVDEDRRTQVEDHTTGKVDVMRTITKFRKLYDVSAVSLPANDATEISARAVGDGLIAEIQQERREAQQRQRAKDRLRLKIKIMGG